MGGKTDESHNWIVDRFEGDLAVVETDGEAYLDVPRWLLPVNASEGDWIALEVGGADGQERTIRARIDAEATESARAEAAQWIEDMRDEESGGDIVL